MSVLLRRSGRRFFSRHPWQYALAVAGIALGVAVVVGVDLAAASAERAFLASRDSVTGRATHQLVTASRALPESLFTTLRTEVGVHQSAPVVEGSVTLASDPGRRFTVLGVDPLSEGPFRDYVDAGGGGEGDADVGQFMTTPGAVLVSPQLGAELDVGIGETFDVTSSGGRRTLEVVGIIPADRARRDVLDDIVVADIATAQDLVGQPGRLSRIDLRLAYDAAMRLQERLPAGVEVATTGSRTQALYDMTRAFRINLLALSLLALVVGAFLIYSTLAFLVVRRRPVTGTLRSLGVSRRELFVATCAEALMLSLPGVVAGLALGVALGAGLTGLVAQTIDDLYFRLQVDALNVSVWVLLKGAVLGLGVAVLAAIGPAREAASTPPRALLSRAYTERVARRRLPWLVLAALALSLLAGTFLALSTSLVGAFAGLFCVIVAMACITPPAVATLLALLSRIRARAPWFGMTVRGAAGSLSRTGVAMAALTVAMATVVGIGTMVGSFRASVNDWLGTTLTADLYLGVSDAYSARGGDVDQLVAELGSMDAVSAVALSGRTRLATVDGEVRVWLLDPTSRWQMTLTAGDWDTARSAFLAGEAVLVSEPLARRRGLGPGDRISLPSPGGPLELPVAAVFLDYTSDQGVVTVHMPYYEQVWGESHVEGIGLELAAGVDVAAARAEVSRLVGNAPGITLSSSGDIRQASMDVFDRTFLVTNVLEFLVAFVAFLGIASALQSLQMERSREVAVLRAVGMTPGQVRRMTLTQTGLLGGAAGLLALPAGMILAVLLIRVINERSFGWSMQVLAAPGVMAQALLLSVAAAVLAGLYPAWRLAARSPSQDLREE